jgi:hypothetical protein
MPVPSFSNLISQPLRFSIAFYLAAFLCYLNRRFNVLYLTNRRLVKEEGIILKRFVSVFLEEIVIWGVPDYGKREVNRKAELFSD